MRNSRVFERMTRVETLLENHLRHHDMYLKYISFPILVGVSLLVGEKIYSYVMAVTGG